MRSVAIGVLGALLAAVALLATPAISVARTAPVAPQARKLGMAAAPAIISQVGMECRLADARYMGGRTEPKSKDRKEDRIDYYEIACAGAEGFIVATHTSAPTEVYTCLEAVPVRGATCQLPGNDDPKAGIAPELAAAGVSCAIRDARGIGHTDDGKETVFEVACRNGAGYILHTSFQVSAARPARVDNCLAVSLSSAGPACTLTLTDAAAVDAALVSLVSQSGETCQVKDRRFVGKALDDSFVYEVACQDGKGYLILQSDSGSLVKAVDCADADRCTLTNPRAPEIQQAALYSKLALAAGYACDVSRYAPFQVSVPGGQAIELQCSNRADGAVAIFPASDHDVSQIYDCAHAELVGFRCQFTQADAALPNLTGDLHKLGKTSCVVSSSRVAGTTSNIGYIEVACADGAPGYFISYTLPAMTPTKAIACGLARYIGGGCTLPGNTRRN